MKKDREQALRREQESLQRIIVLAHKWGWDGVNNSKVLELFLENYVEDLRRKVNPIEALAYEVEQALKLIEFPERPHKGMDVTAMCDTVVKAYKALKMLRELAEKGVKQWSSK